MRRGLRRAARGYSRTAVVGLATTGLLLGALVTASGAQGETVPFSNGTAKATAIVSQVAPGIGNLQLGITAGVAVSEIKNTIGQAQAKTLDLGLIGGTLTAESCTGSAAAVKQSDLPQPLRVDSRGGATKAAKDDAPINGATIGGGRKEVEADQTPSAKAVAKIVEVLGGFLTLEGGRAEAVTRVVDKNAREAHAKVSVDLNIGGFLDLSGLRWDAFHRTGKDAKADATFDLGTAALLGVPIPLESLAQIESLVNTILAPSGVSITFPKVERFTTPADLIRVTPMQILLKDSPAGAATLGPILNLSREQREDLFDEISKAYCSLAGAVLVGDIGIAVASGTGFLALQIGGAEATTGELVLESPFGSESPVVTAPGSLPTIPTILPSSPIAPGPGVVQPAANVGPLEDHCESAHPLKHTACSRGALLAVGLAGVLATAAVGALDWRHQRRRRARAEAVA
jgi:hypothetical protein